MEKMGGALKGALEKLDKRIEASQQRKGRLQSEGARYTTIYHHTRKTLGLTIEEYCLADTIYKLSGSHSAISGWCYASKKHFAKDLEVSERRIFYMLTKLINLSLVEVEPEKRFLRTTKKWWEAVEVARVNFRE